MAEKETDSYLVKDDKTGEEFEVKVPKGTPVAEVNKYIESQFGGGGGDDQVDDGSNQTTDDDYMFGKDFAYMQEKKQGLGFNFADYMESVFPLGGLVSDENSLLGFSYKRGDEVFGKGYMEASPEKRREMIMQYRTNQLKEEFGENFTPDPDSWGSTLGGITGTIKDPTSALPMGHAWKAAAAVGGLIGGSSSVAEDLVENKPVDLTKAAISTGGGAILGGGAKFGIDKMVQRGARKTINKVNAKVDDLNKTGVETTVDDVYNAANNMGISNKKLDRAYNVVGEKPYARTVNLAETSATKAVVEDSATSRLYSQGLDDFLGVLSTQVRKISEPLHNRLTKMEFHLHKNTQDNLLKVKDFAENIGKSLTPRMGDDFALHLFNGRFDKAQNILSTHAPHLIESFTKAKGVLDDLGGQMHKSFDGLDNYFPRSVKDYDGLSNAIGNSNKGILKKSLKKFADSKGIKVNQIAQEDKDIILNQLIRGYKLNVNTKIPSFVKDRQIAVTDDLLKYYHSPAESIQMYVRKAVNTIERNKFFVKADGSTPNVKEATDISAWVSDEFADLGQKESDRLIELLQTRFVHGEVGANKFFGKLRDTGYAGTIANPYAAITQLGDLGISAYKNGLGNTLKAVFSKKDAKLIDIGLDQMVSKEFSDPSAWSNGLHKLLSASGFRHIDKFGKETFINATFNKAAKQVKSEKGLDAFNKKWGSVFGKETDSLIKDLQEGVMSENVKLMMFNSLSEVQPISLSEMPVKYLQMTNGRLAYMLKSFALKQLDVVRRDVIQEGAKGGKNTTQAAKNLGRIMMYMAGGNTATSVIKDWARGREVSVDDVFPGGAIWSLLGVYGFGKFSSNKLFDRGKISSFAADTVIPAMPLLDAGGELVTSSAKGDPKFKNTIKAFPVVGQFMHQWFLGGAEEYNRKQRKKRYGF